MLRVTTVLYNPSSRYLTNWRAPKLAAPYTIWFSLS
uniref:Uncharacterized protein n=1 Tax=Rhizophora mucronata TaxID=61149 RepID=A0A2P2KFA7_RHIMU